MQLEVFVFLQVPEPHPPTAREPNTVTSGVYLHKCSSLPEPATLSFLLSPLLLFFFIYFFEDYYGRHPPSRKPLAQVVATCRGMQSALSRRVRSRDKSRFTNP
jgi:hypothetical protein